MATLAVILVSLLVRLVCGEYSTTSSSSTSSGGGGCVYSFQVWRPNQDVLDQLHHLDQKCSNTTSNLNHQIVLLKNQLLNEVVVGRNISQGLERQLMHQKMERLQLDVMTKDLQLQIVQLKGEQRKIMNRVRSTGGGGGGGGRFEEGELKGMMEQLKNDVGDLKAEWVFIRRKIQDVHDEAKQSSERLREDSMQLKVEVESMKAGAVVLGQKHGELNEQMQKIKEDGNGGMRSEQEDRLLGHVRELQAQLGHLGNGLSALQQQHATLAQQLLAVVMTTNNVSNDDLASWMQKMPRMGGEVELGRPPREFSLILAIRTNTGFNAYRLTLFVWIEQSSNPGCHGFNIPRSNDPITCR
ncbi:hypothetical protein CAPTEDRAFT_194516 [Capitella teleta]|uniref:Fibrinogen C-terminal domain-containing protein n=1 Tax=Capitella teleta TaxID=283909 RepID=R7T6H8_CAPTE|nr:hypothetical protein CAPTEDRAFT_194516 [Capitella teleta]|eukprot:ELT89174.1 hypothetical protein CAPTEDRAFT_194516 [Capitella teleta]